MTIFILDVLMAFKKWQLRRIEDKLTKERRKMRDFWGFDDRDAPEWLRRK